jgi:amino-acid N-acetyltransferase
MTAVEITNAADEHFSSILELLRLSKLPEEDVDKHLVNYLVAVDENKLVGCVGLEVYEGVGLLRSLAVHPEHQGKGIGTALLQRMVAHAKEKGLSELYLLTATADKFFLKQGFAQVAKDEADKRVKESVEFKSVCPEDAVCMKKVL